MRGIRSLVWLPVFLSLGCYAYAPAPPEAVAPGNAVRAWLTPGEAERVREVLPAAAVWVEGTVVSRSEEALLLELPIGTGRLSQRVLVPAAAVVRLERRRLDRTRTGLVAAAGTAVLAAVLVKQLSGGELLPGEPPSGGPAEVIVPAATLLRRLLGR